MSLKPQTIPEIPLETVRVVHAVFPAANIYLDLRDILGTIYQDELFADLYSNRGQPAYAPWRALRHEKSFSRGSCWRPLSFVVSLLHTRCPFT